MLWRKKRKEDVKAIEGGRLGEERDRGLREEHPLEPADSLHSPHPFGPFHPHTHSSFSLWWSECQKKGLKLLSLFWWEVTEELFPSAIISALQPPWISCQLWPRGKLLNHHLHVWVCWCTQGKDSTREKPLLCACTTVLPPPLWSLDRSPVFMHSVHSTQGWPYYPHPRPHM